MKKFSKYTVVLSLMAVATAPILSGCTALSGRETTTEYLDDAGITASVKSDILKDPELSAVQIHVETFKGIVQLSGFVDSLKKSTRAANIARHTQGVRSVKNNIIVRR